MKYTAVRVHTVTYVEFIKCECPGDSLYEALDNHDALPRVARDAATDRLLVSDRTTACSGGIERDFDTRRWRERYLDEAGAMQRYETMLQHKH